MDRSKIIIAGSKEVIESVKKQLSAAPFTVLDGAFSGNEVLRRVAATQPDIVIADYTLSDMTGIELAKALEDLRACPAIILANRAQSEYVEDMKSNALDIFCVTKPVSAHVLSHTVSLVLRLTKKVHEYEHQVDELKHQLEDRKLIDKAKGILMKKFGMSEEEAYNELRKKAMNSSRQISQIAKTIIDMFELMK